ncbi:MAG: BatD family protein [Bacteroidetes bacterium]|nr:BatD family protein [Bacteroidota bacterium]
MSVKNLKYLFPLLMLTVFNAYAQSFTASAERTTVGQGQRFQVFFEFKGTDQSQIRNFIQPSFRGFKILSGPNQSTSMQIINGSVSSSITYSYILYPEQEGTFTIDKASVELGGRRFETDPLKITVVKGNAPQQAAQQDQGISSEELNKNVFIVAEADRRNVLKGEQVTVTYKLYTKAEISSPKISKLPTYQGFWSEELETGNVQFGIEMYNGERYRAALIKKVALFPTKAGKLEITPFELTVPVIVKRNAQNRDMFDSFFNDSFFGRRETIEHQTVSNRLTINVNELPQTGKPESFNGAVGQFTFDAAIDKQSVQTNETITLKMNLQGKGNVKLLDLPEFKLPIGFEQYEPKTSEVINRSGVVSGSKKAEFLIVPRISGTKVIEPIEFSYFNPQTNRYHTVKSPPFNIDVKKGAESFESSASGFSKEDIKLLSEDIRFIKTSGFNLSKKESTSEIKSWFWISLILPFIAFVAVISVKRSRDKLSGNIKLLRYQKAEKAAQKRLKIAKKNLVAEKISEFYNSVSQALFGYLEDKLSLPKADFTVDRVKSTLGESSADDDLNDHVIKILEKCEYIRFAPQGESAQSAKDFYESTVKVIIGLENSIVVKKK